MTSSQRSRGLGFTIALASMAITLTILVAIAVAGWPNPVRPSQSLASVASPPPTPASTASVACTEETAPLALGLAGPACPMAILAVELAVAPVRLPIDRIVIQPGPFYCDVIWPGVQTIVPCRGYAVQAGQFMHAWVGFAGSPKVAVVALGLDLPEPVRDTGRTRPPWQTTVVTVDVPPDGWVLP